MQLISPSVCPLHRAVTRINKTKNNGHRYTVSKKEKVAAYADDTTFFVKTNYEIWQIIDAFTLFGKGSGSKLNLEKAVAIGLGKWKKKADYPFGIEEKNEIKTYGITFTNRPEDTEEKLGKTRFTNPISFRLLKRAPNHNLL